MQSVEAVYKLYESQSSTISSIMQTSHSHTTLLNGLQGQQVNLTNSILPIEPLLHNIPLRIDNLPLTVQHILEDVLAHTLPGLLERSFTSLASSFGPRTLVQPSASENTTSRANDAAHIPGLQSTSASIAQPSSTVVSDLPSSSSLSTVLPAHSETETATASHQPELVFNTPESLVIPQKRKVRAQSTRQAVAPPHPTRNPSVEAPLPVELNSQPCKRARTDAHTAGSNKFSVSSTASRNRPESRRHVQVGMALTKTGSARTSATPDGDNLAPQFTRPGKVANARTNAPVAIPTSKPAPSSTQEKKKQTQSLSPQIILEGPASRTRSIHSRALEVGISLQSFDLSPPTPVIKPTSSAKVKENKENNNNITSVAHVQHSSSSAPPAVSSASAVAISTLDRDAGGNKSKSTSNINVARREREASSSRDARSQAVAVSSDNINANTIGHLKPEDNANPYDHDPETGNAPFMDRNINNDSFESSVGSSAPSIKRRKDGRFRSAKSIRRLEADLKRAKKKMEKERERVSVTPGLADESHPYLHNELKAKDSNTNTNSSKTSEKVTAAALSLIAIMEDGTQSRGGSPDSDSSDSGRCGQGGGLDAALAYVEKDVGFLQELDLAQGGGGDENLPIPVTRHLSSGPIASQSQAHKSHRSGLQHSASSQSLHLHQIGHSHSTSQRRFGSTRTDLNIMDEDLLQTQPQTQFELGNDEMDHWFPELAD